jgi:hypothetical protein
MPLPLAPSRRTPDAMRAKLLGRIGDEPMAGAGRVVLVAGPEPRVGVVVCEEGGQAYVWVDETGVKLASLEVMRPYEGLVPAALERRAELVRGFAELREKSRIVAETPTGPEAMVLVEKCRLGVLAARGDGSIVALGLAAVKPLH